METSAQSVGRAATLASRLRFPALSADRRVSLRESAAAFGSSRLLVLLVGAGVFLLFGFHPAKAARLDPLGLTAPFDHTISNALAAAAARWDSSWYLGIAEHGYSLHGPHLKGVAAFFPLYPALIAAVSPLVGSPLLAGVLISCASSLAALYLLHRLAWLEFDQATGRATVWLFAWLPTALFLSAVYSEGLFLALSIGSFYAGRLGRWRTAGIVGALAAATRIQGVLLIVPLAVLYLYGPRADRSAPDHAGGGLRPRYARGADLLWVCAVPLGLLAYSAYLGIAQGDPAAAFTAQGDWHRITAPLAGIPLGVWKAGHWLYLLARAGASPDLTQIAISRAMRAIVELAFLGIGLLLLRESWRRLPAAYTAYAALGLALPLSVPSLGEPLKSMPRFTLALFPLWIALALWTRERGLTRKVLVVCAPLLAVWTVLFAAWIWAP